MCPLASNYDAKAVEAITNVREVLERLNALPLAQKKLQRMIDSVEFNLTSFGEHAELSADALLPDLLDLQRLLEMVR